MNKDMNAFDVDILRQKLAESKNINALLQTYSENYPEIGNISTAEKWDSLADMQNVPEIRIRRLERVVNLIDTNKKILDVGVGWGDIVPILKKYKEEVDYTGIDFSAEIIEKLYNKYPKQRFTNTTVDNLHDKYDYVLVLEVLEHILPSKIFSFLKEIRRLLKNQGILIVTVPLNENLKNNTFICGKCGSYVNRMGHVRSYSIDLIRYELESAGFINIYTELIYEGYYGVKGTLKRKLRNIAGYILGSASFKPVTPGCVIVKCKKSL